MDHMNDKSDRSEIQDVMEEYGLAEEEAAFAVRLAAGKTDGDLKRHPWPLPATVVRRWTSLLVEHHGFTPEEAAGYLRGDRSVIHDALNRRSTSERGSPSSAAAD
jgi:hypothetical protein